MAELIPTRQFGNRQSVRNLVASMLTASGASSGNAEPALDEGQGNAMAAYIYVVQMDIPADQEAEFNRIYDTQHVPALSKVPGVRGISRYSLESADVDGTAKYLAIYEVDAPDIPNSPAWLAASELGDWASQIRPHTMNRSHLTFKRLG